MSEKDTRKGKGAKEGKGAKDGKGQRDAQQPKQPRQGKQGKDGGQEARPAAAAEARDERPATPAGPARLQVFYREKVASDLTQQFGYKSPMQVPRIEKIVLNMGVGEAIADKKIMDNAVADLTKIAGQKPLVTKARKSVAQFKIRQGYPVGCKVTLRGARMYEFLDRLVSVAMPRIRDFRGISGRAFDGRGNYNMGVKEQIIFPEIEYDKIDAIRGMNITISTSAKSDAEGKALLAAFKFPFRG
jgi:large subunit ribosomal protein L5